MKRGARTTSKKGGRIKGFTAKQLDGLGLDDQIEGAFYGDAALTEGGKLCRRYLRHLDYVMTREGDKAFVDRLRDEFTHALVNGNSQLFREIADFIEAKKRADKNGPVAPAYFYAARFRDFCEFPKERAPDVPSFVLVSPTLSAAWLKGRFRPSVAEIQAHIDEIMGPDSAPDLKTVERIAESIGAKRPGKKSSRNSHYRQFWDR